MTDKPPLPQGLPPTRATRSQVQGQPSDTVPNVPVSECSLRGSNPPPPYPLTPFHNHISKAGRSPPPCRPEPHPASAITSEEESDDSHPRPG